jgi:hypothetical protein
VPYHSNGMRLSCSIRAAVAALCLVVLGTPALPRQTQDTFPPLPSIHNGDEDRKLPNGKSQKDTMAKADHDKALKEAGDLLALAQQLKEEIQKAGDHVVPLSSVKKTEEIEKMAKRIRSRLTQ